MYCYFFSSHERVLEELSLLKIPSDKYKKRYDVFSGAFDFRMLVIVKLDYLGSVSLVKLVSLC